MANEMKHTAEPWLRKPTISERGRFVELDADDYARAQACVNALAGIADPAAFVKRAKAIERTMNDIAFGTQGHAEESDARVIDIITDKARAALALPGGES